MQQPPSLDEPQQRDAELLHRAVPRLQSPELGPTPLLALDSGHRPVAYRLTSHRQPLPFRDLYSSSLYPTSSPIRRRRSSMSSQWSLCLASRLRSFSQWPSSTTGSPPASIPSAPNGS